MHAIHFTTDCHMSPSTAGPAAAPIRRWIEVRAHPTVVRLSNLDEAWITEAYHLTRDVENHLEALRKVLARPQGTGVFLIGPYGSGKSHFLAYLTRALRSAALRDVPPAVEPVSLLNFPAELGLERIVGDALDIDPAPGDRRPLWRALQARHPQGLVLVLDELSEFLRSKPDARRFNEDVRFLQFLGEWAMGNPFWIVAALQEQIEHTGEIDRALYRKIRDRYPLRFLLGPSHLRDLIGAAILVRKEGFAEALQQIEVRLDQALPGLGPDAAALRQIYPLHPATIDFLEAIRDRFSQERGAVDFVCAQLAGRPERGIASFLDRPWGDFITPERIVDHFRDLLDVQSEFLPIAQRVFPHYRKEMQTLFPVKARAELAERLLKLLILAHLTPDHDALSAEQAAQWLMIRVSVSDPEKNVAIATALLDELAQRGRFVRAVDGKFRLDLDDDEIAALERAIASERAELGEGVPTLFAEVVPELAARAYAPFDLPWEEWQSRRFRWHFHERHFAVYVGDNSPPRAPDLGFALCIRPPWGSSEPAAGIFTLVPAEVPPGPELAELAVLRRVGRRSWAAPASERLRGRIEECCQALSTRVRHAYLDARLSGPRGDRVPVQRGDATTSERWLEGLAEQMARALFPAFERFAPKEGPLPKHSYIELARFAAGHDLVEETTSEAVSVVRDGYWVPMGLLERKGTGYRIPTGLERNELVRLVGSRLDMEPPPQQLYKVARAPVFGLVDDQVHLLLLFLLFQGEIDLIKGRKSHGELYETLPNPLHYDRVVAGRALRPEELDELGRLMEGLKMRPPERWTVLAQRRAAERIGEIGRRTRTQLGTFAERLAKVEDGAVLAAEVRAMMKVWAALDEGSDEIAGLRHFLREIEGAERFLARMRELMALPGRIDSLLRERQRFQHLFGHCVFAEGVDAELGSALDELGEAPAIATPDELGRWIDRAGALYRRYGQDYARSHAAWWKEWREREVAWTPPPVAGSRHLGLDTQLEEWTATRACAAELACTGLSDLSFRPLCGCDFDGHKAPFAESVQEMERLRGEIEEALGGFFARGEARERTAELVREGIDDHPELIAYVDGNRPYPGTSDLKRFDRHLAGLDLVHPVDAAELSRRLGERTWSKKALQDELVRWIEHLPGERLRFHDPRSANERLELVRWCTEQALRGGTALPTGLEGEPLAEVAELLRPEWVGRRALGRIDELGLGVEAENRILDWLLSGTLAPPARAKRTPLVEAACDLAQPAAAATAGARVRLLQTLYRHHARLDPLAGERWLEHLDEVAQRPLDPEPPPLTEILREHQDATWIVVDAMGAVLFEGLADQLGAWFPAWRAEPPENGLAPVKSTTDAWYRALIDEGLVHTLEKIDCIDALIHERFPELDDLVRLAAAELGIALRGIVPRLDPGRPLLLCADHGFRIRRDGRGFSHGGSSVAERLVAVTLLRPR